MSRAHQYPRLILALVCLPVFIGALDLTIVSAVLPEVIRSLTVEIQKLDVAGWVVTGYFVSYAISMTFMGRVSDIAGRRVGLPDLPGDLFCRVMARRGLARLARRDRLERSCNCSRATSRSGFAPLYALIVGRVIQAFGAGAMVPVSMALVADLFPPEKRALPLGIVGAVDTAGWVLGHLYGGIMVQFMSWPYLFWINLPIIARDVLRDVVGVGRAAPHGREGRHRLDRRDASWRRVDSAQRRPGLARNRPRTDRPPLRRNIGCTGLPAPRSTFVDLSDFAAACRRSHPQSADLLEPQPVGGEWSQSARRFLHHGGARQRSRLHQCRGRGRTT